MNPSWSPLQQGSPVGFGTWTPGQVVGAGRYQLKRILGQGGMGIVWLAQDRLLREPVALKFLPSPIACDPSALDGLRQETRRSRKLSHPNIVRIHDLHDAQDEPAFISMEYVEGLNLHRLRMQRPGRVLLWTFLAPLVEQLAEALDYAHGERVIHRDLKPANLMLGVNGRLKLADFGLARVISDSMSRITEAAHTSGTLAYMSPQQADGHNARVTDDLYSLGAALYELLAGTPPFHAGDIGYQIRHALPEPIDSRLARSGLSNAIPGEVSSLVMACLAKDPNQRPQDARAVLQWLRAPTVLRSAEATTALPASSALPSMVGTGATSPSTSESQFEEGLDSVITLETHPQSDAHPAPRRSRAWMVGTASCSCMAAIGLAAWQWWLPLFHPPANPDQRASRASLEVPGSNREVANPSPKTEVDADGFTTLFNGNNLAGWEGDPEFWTVRDGAITAMTAEEGIERRRNTCLVWKEPVSDFELRLSFKLEDVITAKPANSGVLYRCRKLDGFEYRGYQVDLHGEHTGKLLLLEGGLSDPRTLWGHASRIKDDHGKTLIQSTGQVTDANLFSAVVKKEDWNELVVLARGRHLTHRINGVITMSAEDESSYCAARSGALALELKRATHLQFKNIRLKHLKPEESDLAGGQPSKAPL